MHASVCVQQGVIQPVLHRQLNPGSVAALSAGSQPERTRESESKMQRCGKLCKMGTNVFPSVKQWCGAMCLIVVDMWMQRGHITKWFGQARCELLTLGAH